MSLIGGERFHRDIWLRIFNNSSFKNKIILTRVCKIFNKKLYVEEIDYVMNIKYVTTNTLKKTILRKAFVLDCRHNFAVHDVSFMKSLQILDARGSSCGVDQYTIDRLSGLNIIELYCDENPKIIDVTCLKTLKVLSVSDCMVGQKGINGLELVWLYCNNNSRIVDVSAMKSLKKLEICGWYCGVTQRGIDGLELTWLSCNDNPWIRDVSFMKTLKKLDICGYNCGVNEHGIKGLDLTELKCTANSKISCHVMSRN
jgi:uncharacterized protein YkvS